MPDYQVNKRFRDIEKDVIYEPGTEAKLTAKRANEIVKKLGDGYIKPVEIKKND